MADKRYVILVVEDELLIRAGVEEHLSECGFTLLSAANADEAVALILLHPEIDLVFTDINMPGRMNGLELARWVREFRPATPVLVTTAEHGRKMAIEELCRMGGANALMKPYEVAALSGRILETITRFAGARES